MIVLGDDLDDVAHPEANACLLTWDEVIFRRVILKLSTYINLWGRAVGQQLLLGADTVAKNSAAIIGEYMGNNVIGQAAHMKVDWLLKC